jgi:NAD-dependent dihydropyrimidine dehydrogenase PreA subunit
MEKKLFLLDVNRRAWRLVSGNDFLLSLLIKILPSLAGKLKDKFAPPGDGVICLPKGRLIQIGESAGTQENTVVPTQVIDHFIDNSSYRAIMNFCLCRDANNCKDYPIELGCLFLGEAARGIHPDIHRSVSKEQAKEHIRRGQEAGLLSIVGRAKFDSVLLDVTPHEKLLTICNCCPCCCITRGVPHISSELSEIYKKMPGVAIHIDDKCSGCGQCVEVCIYAGVEIVDAKASTTDSCRVCGRCAQVCPEKNIKVVIEDEDFVQKAIAQISENVDVC